MKKAELKDRLKEEMDLQGLKQVDLVELGNFDKGQLNAWLAGRYKPKQNNIDKLSRILGVSEAWLMGFDVPKEREEDASAFALSSKEKSLITKYRLCDQHGRELVEYLITAESTRSQREANLIPIAAHHEANNDFTESQKQKIREFTEMALSSRTDKE